ncbi:MAG TPA: hypothetical protein PLD88_09595, partial [Candidatus Berkiella sp.]|nr:hypothetical protein [Candidatus Berkiella sp.]
NGDGVRANKPAALGWFKKAAKERAEYAQYLLGELYAEGVGTRRDLPQAYAWFCISADHRMEQTENSLAQLLWHTTSKDKKRALALTSQFQRYANNDLIEYD